MEDLNLLYIFKCLLKSGNAVQVIPLHRGKFQLLVEAIFTFSFIHGLFVAHTTFMFQHLFTNATQQVIQLIQKICHAHNSVATGC